MLVIHHLRLKQIDHFQNKNSVKEYEKQDVLTGFGVGGPLPVVSDVSSKL